MDRNHFKSPSLPSSPIKYSHLLTSPIRSTGRPIIPNSPLAGYQKVPLPCSPMRSPIKNFRNSNFIRSPITSPLRSPIREKQDRFIPARTPRSPRIRLDFSDTDQGVIQKSPFAYESRSRQHLENHNLPDNSLRKFERLQERLDFENKQQKEKTEKTKKNIHNNNTDYSPINSDPVPLYFTGSRLLRNNRSPEAEDPVNTPITTGNDSNNNNNNLDPAIIGKSTIIDQFNMQHKNRKKSMYNAIIANELLGAGIQQLAEDKENCFSGRSNRNVVSNDVSGSRHSGLTPNLAQFKIDNPNVKNQRAYDSPKARQSLFEYTNISEISNKFNPESTSTINLKNEANPNSKFSSTCISNATQNLLNLPKKQCRYIPKTPFKVLDAPDLTDDFYLNLVDWGNNNFLAVALGSAVYLWNAEDSKVSKLCDYNEEHDNITSVAWCFSSGKSSCSKKNFGKAEDRFFGEKVIEKNQIQEVKIDPAEEKAKKNKQICLDLYKKWKKSNVRVMGSTGDEVLNLSFDDHSSLLNTSNFSEPTNLHLNQNTNNDESSSPSTLDLFDRLSTPTTSEQGSSTSRASPDYDDQNYLETSKNDDLNSSQNNNNSKTEKRCQDDPYGIESCAVSDEDLPIFDTSAQKIDYRNLIATGTSKGYVQVYQLNDIKKKQKRENSRQNEDNDDSSVSKMLWNLKVHDQRIGAIAWNSNIVACGSRDRTISIFDITIGRKSIQHFSGHRQEICGLEWSSDCRYLASGGNDNKLIIWDIQNNNKNKKSVSDSIIKPTSTIFNDHKAAVKALAWSPHQNGVLASGGGTADRTIKFFNVKTKNLINSIDTGSQVCNIVWSQHKNEIVSTHGYSENFIIIWKYQDMTPIAKLTGHSMRVLYLAMSPNGETIVTGAGDETLRFWDVFKQAKSKKHGREHNKLMIEPGSLKIR